MDIGARRLVGATIEVRGWRAFRRMGYPKRVWVWGVLNATLGIEFQYRVPMRRIRVGMITPRRKNFPFLSDAKSIPFEDLPVDVLEKFIDEVYRQGYMDLPIAR